MHKLIPNIEMVKINKSTQKQSMIADVNYAFVQGYRGSGCLIVAVRSSF
jgi:hypothetical protein